MRDERLNIKDYEESDMEDGDTDGDNHSDRDSDKLGNGIVYAMRKERRAQGFAPFNVRPCWAHKKSPLPSQETSLILKNTQIYYCIMLLKSPHSLRGWYDPSRGRP